MHTAGISARSLAKRSYNLQQQQQHVVEPVVTVRSDGRTVGRKRVVVAGGEEDGDIPRIYMRNLDFDGILFAFWTNKRMRDLYNKQIQIFSFIFFIFLLHFERKKNWLLRTSGNKLSTHILEVDVTGGILCVHCTCVCIHEIHVQGTNECE